MTIRGLDSVASFNKQAGYEAYGRYLTGDNPLSKAELDEITAAGCFVFALFEVSTTDIQGGENAGTAHAHEALRALGALGAPRGAAVFFACDEDPAGLPGGPADAIPYYRGTAAIRLSGYHNGAYIGAKGANALLGAGVINRVMIPNASSWSDGSVPKRIDIKQGPTVTIGGVTYDTDEVNTPDVLWNSKGGYSSAAQPTPEEEVVNWRTLRPGDKGQKVVALQGALKAIQRYPHKCNGNYGAMTAAAVKAVQKAHKLPETGECDGATLLAIFGGD